MASSLSFPRYLLIISKVRLLSYGTGELTTRRESRRVNGGISSGLLVFPGKFHGEDLLLCVSSSCDASGNTVVGSRHLILSAALHIYKVQP